MSLRLYVGSVACDVVLEDAKKYGYGLCGFAFSDDMKEAFGLVIRGQQLNAGYFWTKGDMLYQGGEFTDAAKFSCFKINDEDGSLDYVNGLEVDGSGLCMINGTGKTLLGAEFWTGNLLSCRLNDDGSIGELKTFIHHEGSSVVLPRQECAHVHSVYPTPDGRFAVACDLGMDKLVIYKINEDSTLTPNGNCEFVKVPAGIGPRHFAFHPNRKFAYLITEMTDEILTFRFDEEKGSFTQIDRRSGLPEDFSGETMAAEIKTSADGRFLYTTHRKCNIISVFRLDPETGIPERIAGFDSFGAGPRSFAISPDGTKMAIANRDGNNVAVCEVDPETGMLGELLWKAVVMEPCTVVWREVN